ncbi:PRADC1-like protein [Teleopsis dalmanni]|uniref:PRADC1-like protein n=1 Tax=Teleopsis dalmanni TaxID=139649 RepID=UPI0018CFD0B8|nr:PRADC1-like protein [Teleopsis dalmanni]XP_037954895.1 PRADC1-like protein [Teleopsis dalmanni]
MKNKYGGVDGIFIPAIVLICLNLVDFINCFVYPPIQDIITTQDIVAGDIFFEIIDPIDLHYTYRLRPAKFGSSFTRLRFLRAALIPTDPPDACQQIKNQRDLRGNVALIDRGDCSFLTKSINAELAGAKAVIITEYNNESTEFDYYIEMISDNTNRDCQIPSGFLLGKNGLVIRSTLRKLKRKHAVINLPVNLTFTPPAKINHPPWLGW